MEFKPWLELLQVDDLKCGSLAFDQYRCLVSGSVQMSSIWVKRLIVKNVRGLNMFVSTLIFYMHVSFAFNF